MGSQFLHLWGQVRPSEEIHFNYQPTCDKSGRVAVWLFCESLQEGFAFSTKCAYNRWLYERNRE